ncbi:MAG: amidohydrolase [Chloroflexi bacterium]|nr:amidohydrolase [Chloroflexota bacterium]
MQADLILYNGNIHTMDDAAPHVQSVAITGNRVVAVGSDAEMRRLRSPEGKEINLQGRTVAPGFIDAHLHFMSYGLSSKEIDLAKVPTLEQALARVADRAAETPVGQWLTGRGWDQSLWKEGAFPSRKDLDSVAPEHPVFLRRKCGHAGWANSRALELASITAETADPPGGAIDHDVTTSQPTGILKETAMELLSDLIEEPSLDEAMDAIQVGIANVHKLGLVGVHTMEGTPALRAFQQLRAEGKLKLRVLMQIPEDNLDAAIQVGLRSGLGDELLRIGGVKIFADGALGPYTAHMLEPYSDAPDNYGIAIVDVEHLTKVISKASRAGLASFTHAIGDRANREVLDAIQASREANTGPHLRHRIEHTQLLHPDDIPRLEKLGVIASMQPIHATQDMLVADKLWGARCAGGYPWRSLLDSGAVLAFGSDSPVEDLDVIKGIHAAVTRRRPDGSPGPDGWYPEQALTVTETVYAYTAGAAYASGEETIKGTLSPGKLADLVILSQDIFTIDPMDILETKVLATMFDGEFVYEHENMDIEPC